MKLELMRYRQVVVRKIECFSFKQRRKNQGVVSQHFDFFFCFKSCIKITTDNDILSFPEAILPRLGGFMD